MFRKRFNKTFYRIFSAFMVVILLSMVSYLFFYRSAHHIIKDNIASDGHKELTMFSLDMERSIYDVYKLIYQAQIDPFFRNIDAKNGANYYDYMKIKEYIQHVVAAYPYIYDVVFYDKQSSLTISRLGVLSIPELLSINFINENKNSDFWTEYLNKPNELSTYPKSEFFQQDTYYSKSLVDGYVIKKELSVLAVEHNAFKSLRMLIYLDAERISELYGNNTMVISTSARQLIFDNTSSAIHKKQDIINRIENSGQESGIIELVDDDSFLFYSKSDNYDWYYIKVISYQEALEKINTFNKFALIVVISMCFGGLFLSYFFSLKLYRPIQRLSDLVEKSSTKLPDYYYGSIQHRSNEMQKIYSYLTHLNNNYESIERKYKMMQDIYRELFYVKLIKNDQAEVNESIIKELNIDPADFDSFVVINYTLNFKSESYKLSENSEKLSKMNLSIKELIDLVLKNMNINSYTFQIDSYSSIAILPLAGMSFNIEEFKRRVSSILENDSDILYINFAISRVYRGLRELRSAYNEVLKLSDYYSITMESQFITYESLKSIKDQNVLRRLSMKIKGVVDLLKYENAEHSLNELTKYLEEKNIPLIYIRNGLITLVNDILEKVDLSNNSNSEIIDSLYKDIDAMHSKDDYNKILKRIYQICCDSGKQTDNTCRNSIVEDMVEFIKENYSDEICLDLFAEKYKMSPIYLSKLFKDFKGINYTDFLNEIRMEKALSFLLNTDIKIKDISVKVGYKDPNAFIKAFKKNFGISPGKYRRINIVSNQV